MSASPKIAVHLHLFYVEMWGMMRGYLSHLEPYGYHLCVTLVAEAPALEAEIRAFHPGAEVWVVENRGYDVGPFLSFLHRVDLSAYEVVLKLHTKNDKEGALTWINHRRMNRRWWARLLPEALLGSPARVQKNLELFACDSQLGMLGSTHLVTYDPAHGEKVREELPRIMRRLGYEAWPFGFVVGTMFMVRSCILQKIKDCFGPGDCFPPSRADVRDGTTAHAFERAFGCLTLALGYKIAGVGHSFAFELAALGTALLDFLYKRKVTAQRRLIIKICRIPVYIRRLPQEP